MICKKIRLTVDGKETEAELTCYIKEQIEGREDALRKAVVICPGGAYAYVSDREADPVAMQFLAMDVQVFILNYSVAPHIFPESLLQLAAAVAYVRDHAAGWYIDPDEIGVLGFSAGGHLAASLGVFWNRDFLSDALKLSPEMFRPNRLMLAYPVITSGEFTHEETILNLMGEEGHCPVSREFLSLENQIGSQVPPTFLWHTDADQTVPVENALLFAMALKRAKVSLELHIYREGRHGLALANTETRYDVPYDNKGSFDIPSCQSWISLIRQWLQG